MERHVLPGTFKMDFHLKFAANREKNFARSGGDGSANSNLWSFDLPPLRSHLQAPTPPPPLFIRGGVVVSIGH